MIEGFAPSSVSHSLLVYCDTFDLFQVVQRFQGLHDGMVSVTLLVICYQYLTYLVLPQNPFPEPPRCEHSSLVLGMLPRRNGEHVVELLQRPLLRFRHQEKDHD